VGGRGGIDLSDGDTCHGQDRHRPCHAPHTEDVKVTELIGHKLQASEADGLVRDEVGNVPLLACVANGELRAPEADIASDSSDHHVDVEGRHRKVTWL
jgi:hypothetical protein